MKLKQEPGKNIIVGSPSVIVELINLDLIDEYQFCIHPIVLGNGLALFKNNQERTDLKLLQTKPYGSGAVTLTYERRII